MNYVLIRNGTIVNSKETYVSDVLIGNNKIIDVAENISRPDPETPVIDATGKFVLPGAIDTNRTFSDLGAINDEMLKLCRAEIIGGTTSMLEVLEARSKLKSSDVVHISRKHSAESLLDFSFHIPLNGWSAFNDNSLEFCFAHEGITTFYIKSFTEQNIKRDTLKRLLKKINELGLLLLVEINEPDISGSGYTGAGSNYDELVSFHLENLRSILDLITETQTRTYFFNISFKEELDLLFDAQKKNNNIYAELALPCYIGEGLDFVVDEKTILQGFPLEGKLTLIPFDQFWTLLKDEHFLAARPTLRVSNIDDSNDMQVFNRPDKYFVLKNTLSVLFTAGVTTGNIEITDFCNMVSEKPAKLMGMYPQKGLISSGSDADILIWDPETDRNLYFSFPQNINSSNPSSKLKGKSQFVFINGVMAYDGEVFYGQNLSGKFLYRIPSF
jgi:dihydroorotase-like cyclic amidohydrolase